MEPHKPHEPRRTMAAFFAIALTSTIAVIVGLYLFMNVQNGIILNHMDIAHAQIQKNVRVQHERIEHDLDVLLHCHHLPCSH